MKIIFALVIALLASKTVYADSITIPLDAESRAASVLPDYVVECQSVLKATIESNPELKHKNLNYKLTDLDQNSLVKYLWWTVSDQDNKVVLRLMMQKPIQDKCF